MEATGRGRPAEPDSALWRRVLFVALGERRSVPRTSDIRLYRVKP